MWDFNEALRDKAREIGYGRAMGMEQVSRKDLVDLAERLLGENSRLRADVERLSQRVAELEAELTTREPASPRPPGWVKPNKPARPKKKGERKKRAHGFARKRTVAPDRVVEHAVDRCPDCGCALFGGTIVRHREVIEIDLPPAVVTDHRLRKRVCPHCARSCVPTVDAADGVVGQRRVGANLLALIATLHEESRMPVEGIQQHLATIFGVRISVGAIADALRTVATRGTAQVEAIHEEIRQSPVVHADETGWREDGENRYAWLIATPTARYFAVGRRTTEKIDTILGKDFAGTLVTDFYAAYDHFPGEKQRCWAHLLRDVKDLRAQFPQDAEVALWAHQLRRLYRAARDRPPASARLRLAKRRRLEERVTRLCEPFVDQSVPQRLLCQRILKHLNELFTFVTDPRVPPTNNEAERAIRPVVTGRKVSGGTRSAQGSSDAMKRASLFRTWHARDLNPFTQVRSLLLAEHA